MVQDGLVKATPGTMWAADKGEVADDHQRRAAGARRQVVAVSIARVPLRRLDQRPGSPSPAFGAGVCRLSLDAKLRVARGRTGIRAPRLRSRRDATDSFEPREAYPADRDLAPLSISHGSDRVEGKKLLIVDF